MSLITLVAWGKMNGIPESRLRTYAKNELVEFITFKGLVKMIDDGVPPPPSDDIECMICQQKLQSISEPHVKKHGITIAEYIERYPDAPTISKTVSDKIAQKKIGTTRSEETKRKVSETKKRKFQSGEVAIQYRSHSEETKEKIRQKAIGRKQSQETIDKRVRANTGRTHTEEAKERIRQSNIETRRTTDVIERTKQTNLEKYGVEYHITSEVVANKIKNTNVERYGVEYPLLNESIVSKVKETNLDKYGVEYPLQNKEILQKTHDTIKDRYGDISVIMENARKIYKDQTGFANPYANPEIINKIKSKLLQKYGVEHPLQSDTIKDRVRAKFDIYTWTNQEHIPEKSIEILINKTKLMGMLETKSAYDISKELSITQDLVYKYAKKHAISLPKSSYETAMYDFLLNDLGIKIEHNTRKIIPPFEIDFYCPDHKIGIEICGLYYHSEFGINKLDKTYHLKKLKMMEEKGLRLITIFEDELVLRKEIVKNRLRNIFGKTTKGAAARKLKINTIEPSLAKEFTERYHIQGFGNYGFVSYGAFENDKLVGVMTFSKPRISLGRKEGHIELLRFVTGETYHSGMASKMFTAFLRDHPDCNGVISYADRRWSVGNLYDQLGFRNDGYSRPSYSYFKNSNINREYRWKYQKQNIKHLVEDGESKSETEIMVELGYNRIWDCGTIRYIWERK